MRLLKLIPLLALTGFALAACAKPYIPRASRPAPVAPSAAVPAVDNALWGKPGASNAQYRADLEACFNYARAQIAHDERIESETGAAFDTFSSGDGMTELSARMSRFERGNRRSALYGDCMRAKGYSQN